MSHSLLTATGPDRPGIVAALTQVLYENGGNLEDSAMTRLQGEFAVLLIFSMPAGADTQKLAAALKTLEKSHGLSAQIKPLAPQETVSPPASRPMALVTVYGADQPGIVYRVTQALSRQGFNITDLTTHRTETGSQKAGYILCLEGEIPTGAGVVQLEKRLGESMRGLNVSVSVKPLDSSPL